MRNSRYLLLLLCIIALKPTHTSGQSCHGGGGPTGGGAAPVSNPSIPAIAACKEPDTSKFSVSIYGNLAGSLGPDGHKGDPLGTGGKLPLEYNLNLYKEFTPSQPGLFKQDLRVQYLDFGYIPIWRTSVLYAQTNLKLREDLSARLGLSYGGEPGLAGTNTTSGSFGLGEATVQWRPKAVPGLSFMAGNILDVGTYSTIFDQAPMENFAYSGVLTAYSGNLGTRHAFNGTIAGGTAAQNIVSRLDPKLLSGGAGNPYTVTVRQRTYLYAKTGLVLGNLFSLRAIGGYQYVPTDTAAGTKGSTMYPKSEGWHAGIEISVGNASQSHSVVVSWGLGDVVLGWGSPDYVRFRIVDTVLNSGADTLYVNRHTKKSSSLSNLIYWGNYRLGRLNLAAGAWLMLRNPAQNTFLEPNPHYGPLYSWQNGDSIFAAAGVARGDSIVELTPQPFRAAKLAIFPTLDILRNLSLGMRLDHIRYLTPQAHTNLLEPVRDPALRYETYPGVYDYNAPALWDVEAVNATVVSPTLALNFGGIAGITATYSMGFYDEPVSRQGMISNRHSNATISTYFNYRFRS